MSSNTHLEQSYLALVEFLLLSKRQIVEIGQEHNLTAMQAMTLFLLDRPRPMRDFITIFNCDPSNVTGIVDGLKPEGTKIRTALVHQLVGPKSYILGNLTPDEVDQFIALTQKITRQS
jgi:hypothetical protein